MNRTFIFLDKTFIKVIHIGYDVFNKKVMKEFCHEETFIQSSCSQFK